MTVLAPASMYSRSRLRHSSGVPASAYLPMSLEKSWAYCLLSFALAISRPVAPSAWTAVKMKTPGLNDSTSRPCSVRIRVMVSMLAWSWSGVYMYGNQPSAYLAVRRMAGSLRPATHIGGRGFWTGAGSMPTSSSVV